MEYSYKFRLYPDQEQAEMIERTFGCCRYVYNYFLTLRKDRYESKRESMNYCDCSRELTRLKKELEWLREPDKYSLQNALKDLNTAYVRFFRNVKEGKPFGYPNYKRKKDRKYSYKTNNNTSSIEVIGKFIKLPKLGLVKCKISKKVVGRILNATISKRASGKYYVSICCTDIPMETLPTHGTVAGVDLGIKDLAITSDGKKYINSKYANASQGKLAKYQRQLSRKTKGSNRWEKQRIKVARLHEHIANQRRDAMQKATTDLIRNYDLICIEDLNARGMMKNHKLARSLADASFAEFRRELEYKADWYGRKIQVIDRFYPSSQICSVCGFQNHALTDLLVRSWECPNCGAILDRDMNAAENILHEGIRLLSAS